ncbi:Fe-S cluster assembly protein SufD [bacterium]|jgi:Fe-S cluster assembly protein SufD|nr:Fe-S cluster assembly protein SufD [bacterium]
MIKTNLSFRPSGITETDLGFELAPGTVVNDPLWLLHKLDNTASVNSEPIQIVIGEGASLTMGTRIDRTGTEDSDISIVYDVKLAKGASVHWTSIQSGSTYSVNELITVTQLADSRLDRVAIVGDVKDYQSTIRVALDGEGAHSNIQGLGLLKDKQELDLTITIDHNVPNCTSNQLAKNILADCSKTTFTGLVSVARDAQKTNTEQLNRNLLLSDQARAISQPQLLIDADDVLCAHGSTTGALEESQLFYLMSRGLSREDATSVMVVGFAEEVVEGIPNESVKAVAKAEMTAQLALVLEGF